MKKINQEEDEFEKKIEAALYKGAANEYAQKIQQIHKALSKPHPNPPIPEAKFFLAKVREYEKEKVQKKRQLYFYSSIALAAASLLLVFLPSQKSVKRNLPANKKPVSSYITAKVQVAAPNTLFYQKKSLRVGEQLAENSVVYTTKKQAILRFGNLASVTLAPDTQVTLKQLYRAKDPTVKLALLSGSATAEVRKAHKNESFSIETPGFSADVRGTKFVISIEKERDEYTSSSVEVLQGSVAVYTLDKDGNKILQSEKVLDKGEKMGHEKGSLQLTSLSWLPSRSKKIAQKTKKKVNLIHHEEAGVIAIDQNKMTEEQLRKKYKQLERFVLKNGKVFTGVLKEMNQEYLILLTTEGTRKMASGSLLRQETISH